MIKRIVLCFDGTWNTPDSGPQPSNVVKIQRALSATGPDGVRQVTYYDTGVGTGDEVDKVVGGAFGDGLSRNIRDGYQALCRGFAAGDEIYLFGFSRGAFTARSLGGFLKLAGIIPTASLAKLDEAWQLYRTKPAERDAARVDAIRALGVWPVPVKCIGVWDTVGALGIPGETLQWVNRGKYEFHDTQLGDHVEFGFHAVAIDEKRGPFAPTLWEAPQDKQTEGVEQAWFPGVHTNIGGGYPDPRLSDLALRWMIQRVRAKTALAFDDDYLAANITCDPLGEIYDSRSVFYTVSRALPFQRVIGGNVAEHQWWRRLVARTNQPAPGNRYVNEMLHWSALARFDKAAPFSGKDAAYHPGNLAAAIGKLPEVPSTDDCPPD